MCLKQIPNKMQQKQNLKQFSPSWQFLYLNASELGAKKSLFSSAVVQ